MKIVHERRVQIHSLIRFQSTLGKRGTPRTRVANGIAQSRDTILVGQAMMNKIAQLIIQVVVSIDIFNVSRQCWDKEALKEF
jgi:hypothetical protein